MLKEWVLNSPKYGDTYALLWESSTMVEEFLLIDQYHTEPSWGGTESKLNRLKVLGVSCVTLFTSKYGPQKESPLKTLSHNKPNKFKHIQPRFLTPQNPRWRCIAWYWSTCTCLTKTLKVGELLVHDILWGETEIETGTETERWSDSMTILISLTELTFLSKISTGNFSGKPVKVHVFHWCDEWLVSRQELTRDWRVWLTTMRVGRNTQFTVH